MNEISLTILWASHVLDVSWSLRILTLGTVRNSSHLYCLCKEHTSVFQSLTSLSISETYIVWNKNSKCSEIMYLWQVFISHTLLGDTHIIFWSQSLSKMKFGNSYIQIVLCIAWRCSLYLQWEAPSFHCLAGQTVEHTVRLIHPVDDGSCPLPITYTICTSKANNNWSATLHLRMVCSRIWVATMSPCMGG